MTNEQYALLIRQLSALSPRPDVYECLDSVQLGNLAFLLSEAHQVCYALWREQLRTKHEAARKPGGEE